MSTISIFDISLILDLIAHHLPSADLKNCVLTCRGWYHVVSPHLWKNIGPHRVWYHIRPDRFLLHLHVPYIQSVISKSTSLFRLLQQTPIMTNRERARERLIQRGIRRQQGCQEQRIIQIEDTTNDAELLQIFDPTAEQLLSFDFYPPSLPRLEHKTQPFLFNNLTIIVSLCQKQSPGSRKTDDDTPLNVLAIAAASPQLVVLKICHFILSDIYVERLCQLVESHPSLKRLMIRARAQVDWLKFRQVLKICRKLEHLTILCYSIGEVPLKNPVIDTTYWGSSPSNLISVTFVGCSFQSRWDPLIGSFLKSNSKLQSIVLPEYFNIGLISNKKDLPDFCQLNFNHILPCVNRRRCRHFSNAI